MSGKRLSFMANILIFILIGVAIIWILSYIKHVVFMIIVSVFMAYLIKPPVDFLCKYGLNIRKWGKRCECKGLSRTASIIIVYIILIFVIIFLLSFAVPKINSEAVKFINNFPQIINSLEQNIQNLNNWIKPRLPVEVQDYINQSLLKALEEIGNFIMNLAKQTFSIIGTIFSTLASLLIVPLLAFLLLKDADFYRDWFLLIFPLAWRKELQSILIKIDDGLGGFIRGQILVCICIGISIIIALYAWGIDYALLIGTSAGILNIIPYAGPIVGSIPALLLAFAKSPLTGLGVLITFLVIHEIEKQLISPALVGHSVGLPTLIVIISILAGIELLGILGVLIAVPSAVTLKVVLTHIHQKWSQTWPENSIQEIDREKCVEI
ncbi:MAG TPA: AI-2E family transporter [Candidatus Eremiobacteraeota bacterium]|nr:MAG: pheromone autoinducer 2 transporter [bacterium ADurb.Bin363]HPZ07901.1 AI-2E family transporter [Candidatus Eremiobacteraeota bacterium]